MPKVVKHPVFTDFFFNFKMRDTYADHCAVDD